MAIIKKKIEFTIHDLECMVAVKYGMKDVKINIDKIEGDRPWESDVITITAEGIDVSTP
jgi:hypothetical protein